MIEQFADQQFFMAVVRGGGREDVPGVDVSHPVLFLAKACPDDPCKSSSNTDASMEPVPVPLLCNDLTFEVTRFILFSLHWFCSVVFACYPPSLNFVPDRTKPPRLNVKQNRDTTFQLGQDGSWMTR